MRTGFLFIFGVWLAFSCQEIKDCQLETSTEFAIVRFYRADTNTQTAKTVAFSQVFAPGYDQYYISSVADTLDDDTVNVVGLPLYSDAETIAFRFDTDSTNYELMIDYQPHLRIYYDECDPVYSYKIDTATSQQFDSVVVLNPVLDAFVPTNIEIYF